MTIKIEETKDFVFAKLIDVIKKHSIDPQQGDINIICCFIHDLNIKFNIDKNESSRIMNREYDVPRDLRFEFNSIKDKDEKLNIFIKEEVLNLQSLADDLKIIVKNAPNLTKLEKKEVCKNKDYFLIFKEATILAINKDNRLKINETIWKKSNNTLKEIDQDLIVLSFNKKEQSKEKIVVIPFDVDYHVNITKPSDKTIQEVSSETLQGQWLLQIEDKIDNFEEIKEFNETDKTKKIKRLIDISPNNSIKGFGSIVKIYFNMTVFYLVGLSKFDENGKAYSSKKNLKKCIKCILDEYDTNGQGVPLYIPLMGTGRSRINHSLKQSSHFLIKECKKNKRKINGKVYIVVQKKDVEKIRE